MKNSANCRHAIIADFGSFLKAEVSSETVNVENVVNLIDEAAVALTLGFHDVNPNPNVRDD